MNLFEVFDKSNFDELEQKNLKNVNIEKIVKKKDCSIFTIFLVADEFIKYNTVQKIKIEFKKSIVKYNNCIVKINLKYNLSNQYNAKYIYEYDYDYILNELSERSRVLYLLLKNMNVIFDDNNITLEFMKLDFMKQKADELKEYLTILFKDRYNIDTNIRIVENEKLNDSVIDLIKKENEHKEKLYKEQQNNDLKKQEQLSSENNNQLNVANKDRKKEFYNDDINIYGKIQKTIVDIKNIDEVVNAEGENVFVKGDIFYIEFKPIAEKNLNIITFKITDGTNSIIGQIFIRNASFREKEIEIAKNKLKIGTCIVVKAGARYKEFFKEIVLDPIESIRVVDNKEVIIIAGDGKEDDQYIFKTDRVDTSIDKRVELHLHTKFSDNDAVGAVEDYIEAAHKFGMEAMAITDHGCVQSLAEANSYLKHSKGINLKIINGVEGYLVDDELSTYMNKDFKETDENISFDDEFIVLDIFQTGKNEKKDRIIKINAVKIKNGVEVDRFSEFANPHMPLSFDAKNKTGILDKDLKDKQEEKELLIKFIDFSKNSKVLVNHIPLTSIKFLKSRLKNLDLEFDKNIIDMSTMARTLYDDIKKIKLENIVKKLKIKNKDLLNEKDRLEALEEIFLILTNRLKSEFQINNLYDFQLKFKKDIEFIKRIRYYHIILLAKNDVGRVNLYKLVSESYTNYFYTRPRIPRSLINKYREGLIIGSACIAGELMDAIKDGKDNEELIRIASFYDYLEIQPVLNNSFLLDKEKDNFKTIDDLIALNKKVVELGEMTNKLVVATCDSHYVDKEDKIYRTILKYGESHKKSDEKNKLQDEKDVVNTDLVATKNDETGDDFISKEELYFRTTDEMLKEFEYLGEDKAYEVVVKNTNLINNMIENDISPVRPDKCPPFIKNSDEELRMSCEKKLKEIYGDNPPKDFTDRLNLELNKIIDNGYSVLYISAKRLIDESVKNGYSVGSRGSVGSSFAATMSGITEVNPLPPHYYCPRCKHIEYNTEETNKYYNQTAFDMPDKVCPVCGCEMIKDGVNIPFETFLGINGDKEPDIDLNFATEYQSIAHENTREMFGRSHVFKSGTISAYKFKNARGYVRKYIDDNIKITVDEQKVVNSAEIDWLTNGLVRVKKTTGQHPGGMIVVPTDEEIYTFTPIQYPGNKPEKGMTTHFEYHKIDENLLKLDMLGHDTPSILRKLYDFTNVDPFKIKFYDEKVLDLFKSTKSLGIEPKDIGGAKYGTLSIPEFGTDFAMGILELSKPETVADLIRISGLSHGTNVWQGNIENIMKQGIAKLEDCVCCRDDIMLYLSNKGMDKTLAFSISEKIRKGKGVSKEYEEKMRELNIPDWYIDSCKKIEYLFPKAHAAAYVITALRMGYYKVYFPAEYYAAYFSIKTKHLDYEEMCKNIENVRFYLQKNNKNNDEEQDTTDDTSSEDSQEEKGDGLFRNMKITEEMLARGIEWLPIDINVAKATDFTVINGKVMPSFVSFQGLGEKQAILIEEEQKKEKFKSIKDFIKRTRINKTLVEKMRNLGILNNLPESDEKDLLSFI